MVPNVSKYSSKITIKVNTLFPSCHVYRSSIRCEAANLVMEQPPGLQPRLHADLTNVETKELYFMYPTLDDGLIIRYCQGCGRLT